VFLVIGEWRHKIRRPSYACILKEFKVKFKVDAFVTTGWLVLPAMHKKPQKYSNCVRFLPEAVA